MEWESARGNEGVFETNILKIFLWHLELLTRKRKIIVVTFFLITIPIFIKLINSVPFFTASVIILPPEKYSSGALPGMSGAASRFLGMNINVQADVTALYNDVARSRRIGEKILNTKFETEKFEAPVRLIEYFGLEKASDARALEIGMKIYRGMINVTVDVVSKKATISITTMEPRLSADIANKLAEEIDTFYREQSTGKAAESREFIQGRLESTESLLERAEEKLKEFRQANKRIEKSPELQLEQGRLVRELRIQEEVFITLKKELETVKIEEVKNLPSLRILDHAIPPIEKSGPMRRKKMLVGIILGIGMGIGMAYIWEFGERASHNSEVMKRLNGMTNTIKGDISNIFIFIRSKIFRLEEKGQSVEEEV